MGGPAREPATHSVREKNSHSGRICRRVHTSTSLAARAATNFGDYVRSDRGAVSPAPLGVTGAVRRHELALQGGPGLVSLR